MKRIVFLCISIFCVACWNDTKRNVTPADTVFGGKIINPTDSLVVLFFQERAVDTARIHQNRFSFEFENFAPDGLYYFKTGDNFHYVYLEKGDSLSISANTYNFDNSITCSGRGSSVNNFINEMGRKFAKEQEFYEKLYALPAVPFYHKVDSVYQECLRSYKTFLKKNPHLSEKAQKVAKASFFFDAHKPLEMYLLKYHGNRTVKGKVTDRVLPKYFYNFRKEIKYNDMDLSFYTPYHQYLVQYVNNEAYSNSLGTQKKNFKQENVLWFQIEKLKVIDSVFSRNVIRDNQMRNASFSYLLSANSQDYNRIYMRELEPLIEHNVHKQEIEQLYQTVFNFEKGKPLPDIELTDIQGEKKSIKSLVKGHMCIFYFWSAHNEYAKYLHLRVEQLRENFPNVDFVGVEIGSDYERWLYVVSDTKLIGTQQYYIASYQNKSNRDLISYNVNKALVVNKKGLIKESFVDVFSPDVELEILTD